MFFNVDITFYPYEKYESLIKPYDTMAEKRQLWTIEGIFFMSAVQKKEENFIRNKQNAYLTLPFD